MESEILKQLQQNYPGIPADVAAKFASIVEKACGSDALKQADLLAGSSEFLGLLSEKAAALDAADASLAEYEQAKATAQQFRDALAKELTEREVPEYFWAKAIAVDPLSGEVVPSADAIEGAYKAFLQHQSDSRVDADMRPGLAIEPLRISPAMENFLRSRSNGSPLAGKLKK